MQGAGGSLRLAASIRTSSAACRRHRGRRAQGPPSPAAPTTRLSTTGRRLIGRTSEGRSVLEPKAVVGLDVGTSSARALAFDAEGRVLASAARPYDLLHPA